MSLRDNLCALPRPVWILFAGTFLNRFGTFVMPFLVIYLTRSGYDAGQCGLTISAYGAGHLLASTLGGHLSDRIGRRSTIAMSMFISAGAMIALSQARDYHVILAITFLAGAASEMYRPAASALIGDLVSDEQRVTAFAVFRFALNLGFAAGPATAGLIAEHSFTSLFFGDAATSIVFGIVALFALPHGMTQSSKSQRAGGGLQHALRNEPFVLLLLATLCITWIEFQVTSTFPLHLQASGFSAKTYGFLISLNGAIIVCFELALTAWTQTMPAQRVIALGYALFGVGYSLIGLAHSIPALIVAVIVWTAGEMIFAPVTGAYVTALAPKEFRGRYQGLWWLTWSMGMLAGPYLGTRLLEHDARVYFAIAACAGIAGASLAILNRRRTAGSYETAATLGQE